MKNARRALRAAALAACTLLGPGALAKPVNAPQKPTNMIFVLVDDLRYDAMGFLTPGLQTPNIDALAKNGVYFPNAVVTSSLCSPRSLSSFRTISFSLCCAISLLNDCPIFWCSVFRGARAMRQEHMPF